MNSPELYLVATDSANNPVPGARLHTTVAGSTTLPKSLYSDAALTNVLPNPLVADSSGVFQQFFMETGGYRFDLLNSAGAQVRAPRDYIYGTGSGGIEPAGDHKVMVNNSDTPDYLGNKVYADGGLVVQEVEVDPGVYNLHIFPDPNTLQAKPIGPAGGDLAGTYPDPIVKQLTGVEAALLPIESDFTFSTTPAGTGIGPGRQYLAGVEVRCWAAMGFAGHIRWTRNDFASTTLDTGLWSRGIGTNWNCIRFLYMATFSSWAWVAGDGAHTYIYYALHAPASYNTDGTIKAVAWSSINYGASIANLSNLGDIAQGLSNVSCFVGNDFSIGRTDDFSTFTSYMGTGSYFGGIDTDGYGAWLAILRNTGALVESTDNGLTWSSVSLLSVDGAAASNLPVTHGEQWGSLNYGYGQWIAAVYNAGSGRVSYAYSTDRRSWTTYTDPAAVSFFSAAFNGRKWFATNPAQTPPIWQLLFSEIPAHKRLICEDGLIANGTTFLPDLANAQALATDRNGLLVAQNWINLSSYANASEYRVGGTVVVDSSRNVKGATLWSNGAIRIDANGDFTGRNQTLTGWMALNGATRPAWGSTTPAIAIGGTSSLCSSETVNGSQPSLISNWYFDGANNVAISTYAASNFPRAFVLRDDGAFVGYSSITPPTAGSTVTDLAVRWQFNRFGSLGCFGVNPPTTRPTISGQRTATATLTALYAALGNTGIILDSTTGTSVTREAIIQPLPITNAAPGTVTVAGGVKSFGFDGGASTEELFYNCDIQHDYIAGGDMVFHVHWMPGTGAGGNVKWQIEYMWVEAGGTWNTASSLFATVAAGTVEKADMRADFTLPGTGHTNNSRIMIRLFRNPADAADTYAGDAILSSVGIHYQADPGQP